MQRTVQTRYRASTMRMPGPILGLSLAFLHVLTRYLVRSVSKSCERHVHTSAPCYVESYAYLSSP